ncbi:MAG TPA: SDR family NAD(P)-dependent oxidoreductase, partial [Thermoanaerobaculia bacterium]
MDAGSLDADSVYAACARMGLMYGPAFQGISTIQRGRGEALARLHLPVAANVGDGYVLHPSVMDSALQACVGLLDDAAEDGVRLPFALDSLRVFAPSTAGMTAWVRFSSGSQAGDSVVKVDIDLFDERGNVCIQLRGLSSRLLSTAISRDGTTTEAFGTLIATPVWEESVLAASSDAGFTAPSEHHVIVCELSGDATALQSALPGAQLLLVEAQSRNTIAGRYSEGALACFERIRTILQSKPQNKVLLQIVVPDSEERAVFAGLSGLLKTAALENPHFAGQLVLVDAAISPAELAPYLLREKLLGHDPMVRYEGGARHVIRWRDLPAADDEPALAYKEQGVYLITGGLGGLGVLFARQILERTRKATVILTGRSALQPDKQSLLDELAAAGRVVYRQVDLADADQVSRLIAGIQYEYHRLDGILHCAGMIADHFILRKPAAEFSAVLAPKVSGTFHLDQATQFVELDFFVLFSSIAGALGNLGQADYAAANGFMDHFAAWRNRQVASKRRHGRTVSINWPLWEAGGMGIDPASQELLQQTTGMRPMKTESGLRAFHHSIAAGSGQVLVVEGNLAQMRRALAAGRPVPPQSAPAVKTAPERPFIVEQPAEGSVSLAEKTEDYLRSEFAALLKVPRHKIDPHAPLENYGIDSILAMKLTNQLETTFGSLSKTLFFEYQTIAALAAYFVKAHPAVVQQTVGGAEKPAAKVTLPVARTVDKARPVPARRARKRGFAAKAEARKDIAIVGLAGRYPQAANLQEFWRNLQNGRDCITEIPAERWDHDLYFNADPATAGKTYSKWGGFIEHVDKFDPLFFRISPREAALIDPQERLFLETAWETIEDAGYTKESLAGRRIGVYAGVMWGQYELYGAESVLSGDIALPTSSHASIANRVSYFFDLRGPSIALDTMCSSSLTAIHLACEDIRRGEVDAAIAGGVNVTIHPYKYLSLAQGRFIASDGRCRSFGEGGDGYVPGEGVGAVLLKPLEDALRDGDQVYGVIKSSTVNHGGKTNGYTVPNPNAQSELVLDALKKASIDPKTLSYVETHGTGTSLGDPIEIAGLSKAFEGSGDQKQFCPIGSVKSNIGHLESAAGIAAVTKALLQIRHKQLVPSLHATPLNPNIDFSASPFYVQTTLEDWKRPDGHPRRVGVSSFGAGGSNAHLILEEYAPADERLIGADSLQPEAFVLSARDAHALLRYAEKVVAFLGEQPAATLADLAYTSQVGRTAMSARLVVIATSTDDLRTKLAQWVALRGNADAHADLENVFYGDVREAQYDAAHLIDGSAGKAFLQHLLASNELEKIAKLWILGVELDWTLLARQTRPARVTMPTYPFAKERFWIKLSNRLAAPLPVQTAVASGTQSIAAEKHQRTHYVTRWTAKPLAGAQGASAAARSILILDPTDALFLAMQEREAGDRLLWLRPGTTFGEVEPNVYVIDPEQEEQFDALVAALDAKGLLPDVVLHHVPEPCELENRQDVAQQLDNGLYSLVSLCKALARGKRQQSLKIVSAFSSDADAVAPLAAAMGGFLKTLVLENPRFTARTIDLPHGDSVGTPLNAAQRADLIRAELADRDWTAAQEIRYRGLDADGHPLRAISELVPHVPAPGTAASLMRRNGVYLVTGGMGGLGLIFSEHLAREFQAKLVLVGRSAPNAAQSETLKRLEACGAELLVLQADVAKLDDMQRVVREAKARFGAIDGVIHAAGVNRDAFVLKKERVQIESVLAPKITGAINVDLATREERLDFFVLFSSVAGVTGNIGQSDYAFANRFLDSFAERRESLRAANARSGRTLSIDWPLWAEGGMSISAEDVARLGSQTGLAPLPTEDGLQYWDEFLRSDAPRGVALYGGASNIASYIARQSIASHKAAPAAAAKGDAAALYAKTEAYVKTLIGEEISLAVDRIDSSDSLESFGIDSVAINRINARLERDLGALPKTLLYEHETVRELATFLVQDSGEALTALFGAPSAVIEPVVPLAAPPAHAIGQESVRVDVARSQATEPVDEIAIIGMHGYYPQSANLDEYWNHLRQGKDLTGLVPPNRWDYEEFYHPDPAAAAEGKIYGKWGGFLENYDKFDPHFFKIPTAEAKIIDPQERLFLESVWSAIEDAGYTRDSLRARFPKRGSADVAVFVGVTTNSYHLLAPEERSRGNFVSPSAMPWSIANRVSYFFDFSGPSMPVDTACSSSLVAIHLACESLRSGDSQLAIAGGVNLYLHPSKYHSLCQRHALSIDGKCHSYGAGGDGFVPGEGVGTLVLKPLR